MDVKVPLNSEASTVQRQAYYFACCFQLVTEALVKNRFNHTIDVMDGCLHHQSVLLAQLLHPSTTRYGTSR